MSDNTQQIEYWNGNAGERWASSYPSLDRALSIVRADRSLHLARAAVVRHVRRAKDLAAGLTPGPARDALVHIAEFLAARCGARA